MTPRAFVERAMRLLADGGPAELRIGRLCAALGVTSGSFYHHFAGWDGFVAALLEHWTREEVDRVVDAVRAREDPHERIALLKDLALTLPHGAETALRAWAGTDVAVADAQRRVDARRRAAIVEVLAPVVDDAALRATLAEVGMSILVGHQTLHRAEPAVGLAAQLDQFELLVRTHAREGLLSARA